jgi:hypothetical protein
VSTGSLTPHDARWRAMRTRRLELTMPNQPEWIQNVRCGARTRKGTGCKAPALQNGKCRMHGGLSTGPITAEGRRRIAEAATRRWQAFRQGREMS